MKWEKTNLGEIIEIKKGKYITKKDSIPGPYPVILGGREPAYYINQYNHIGKAIVVSRSGASAGFVSFWDEAIFVTDGFLIEPKENVDIVFLYYLMKSNEKHLIGLQGGVAIPHVTPRTIGAVEIELPPLNEQYKIVNILSAYDDLIENNQKQIRLLEEAAQRLYKDWFVDFHFPGHETVKVVDGAPEGWKKGTIGEIVEYYDKRRKPLSSMQRAELKGKYRYFGAAGIIDYIKSYLFDGIYLLLGEDGSVITPEGNPILQYVSGKFWVNNHAHVLTGKGKFTTEFIYLMFKEMKVSDVVTGVAQPKISQARLSAKEIVMPSEKIVQLFQITIKTIFEKILLLQRQIELATEARDRLLPRLMGKQ